MSFIVVYAWSPIPMSWAVGFGFSVILEAVQRNSAAEIARCKQEKKVKEVSPSSWSLSSDSCLFKWAKPAKWTSIKHLHVGEALPNQKAPSDQFMPSSYRVCLFLNYRFPMLSTLRKITRGNSPLLHKCRTSPESSSPFSTISITIQIQTRSTYNTPITSQSPVTPYCPHGAIALDPT